MPNVIAVVCADIHLSHRPPSARAAEPDWYEAQARPLMQLRDLGVEHTVPVLCAGDVFEHWNSPPELVNFAINALPKGMYAIPGQHDLPHHRLEDIRRSAYWTLVEADVIYDLPVEGIPDCVHQNWAVYGFPWGFDLKSPEYVYTGLNVAVCHKFIYSKPSEAYPGAPPSGNVSALRNKLKGYDVAVFGDNHLGFQKGKVFNCGCLIPRKVHERKYRPSVGLLYDDGSVKRRFLNTSEDKWADEPSEAVGMAGDKGEELGRFLDELGKLDEVPLDFREAVRRYVEDNEVEGGTRKVLLEAMEE